MADSERKRHDSLVRLSGARDDFLANLSARLDTLREGLAALRDDPDGIGRREGVLRRLHATAAAARVLGFASVAEALASAERVLERNEALVLPEDLREVERVFDTVPLLIGLADAPPSTAAESPALPSEPPPMGPPSSPAATGAPLAALVLGDSALAEAVGAATDSADVERAEDADEAARHAETHGPDIIVIDAGIKGSAALVEKIGTDTPVIVVANMERQDVSARWVALGASAVLARPVTPEALRRALREVRTRGGVRATLEPVGEVAVMELADRLASEVRRGLIDAATAVDRRVDLGQGAEVLGAVWGAIARVREIVTLRSSGAVRFHPTGPAGAAPVGAWGAADPGGGQRAARGGRGPRDAPSVPLAGRRIVVADDDPAVRWFIAGLLGAVGCEVIEAQDGLQARDLVFSAWPDALVTDVLMPGLDGFSLCAAVKRDVAMRDAPVMLLSWKEDLLQRIRELGSDADAYLRKEAPASVFVERLREVLRPRARIEARLDTGGEVRGRLDGLTPRLVLELVCRRRLDASVSFNDAAYVYEVEIRDGLVRAATRTAADGSFARGEPVLSGLLGVFAGRFTVTPDRSPCRGLVTGALESVLAEPIARARAAQLALEPGRLALIERIELDLTNISGYLPALPPAAGSLVQGLIEGRPPRELMWSAGGFVERLLDDLARRGAVCAVWGRDAADLLAAARAELEPHPAEPEPKASAFSFEVDAAAEPLEEVASELAGEPLPPRASAPVAAVEPQSEAPKVEAKDESKPTAEQEPEPPALEAEAATPPPKPAPPLKPAPPAKPPTKPQLDAEARVSIPPELDSAVVRLVDKGWDEAPGGPPEFGRAEPRKLEGVDTMPAALQRAPAPKAELTPDALDLGTAVLAAVAQEAPREPARRPSPSPERKLTPSPERKLTPSPERKLTPSPERKLTPSPERKLSPSPQPALDLSPSREAERKPPPKPAAEPAAAPPRKESPAPLPQRSALAALTRPKADSPKPMAAFEIPKHAVVRLEPVKPVEIAKPAEPRIAAIPEPSKPAAEAAPAESDGPVIEVHAEATVSEELPPPLPDVEPVADAEPAAKAAPPPKPAPPDVAPTSLELARTLKMTNAQVQRELEKGRARDDSSPAVAPVITHVEAPPAHAESSEEAGLRAEAEDDEVEQVDRAPRRPQRSEGVWGVVRIAAITTAAAALSYGVVRFAVAPRITGHAAADATAAASAAHALPAAAKPAAKPVPVIQDLDLPADIPVGPDKGLLEVELTERHALYVDGVFVGRGPTRRVPLEPGKHELEVRSAEGASEKHELDVHKGRRTRWELPAAAK